MKDSQSGTGPSQSRPRSADTHGEEAWGCGTAAVVSPIGKLAYGDKEYVINGGKIGEVTQFLYDTLTGIQWGKTEDPFGWVYRV